jgi:hypothetical protein
MIAVVAQPDEWALTRPVKAAGAHDEDFTLGAASTTAVPITANEHAASNDNRRKRETNMTSLAFCLAFPALAEQLKPLEWLHKGG